MREAKHQALAGRHVTKHLGDEVLHHLKRSDRLSELFPLLSVGKRIFIGACLATRRHPPASVTRHAEHPRGVTERFALLQAVLFRYPTVLQRDQAVLDDLERDLVLDLLDAETGRRLSCFKKPPLFVSPCSFSRLSFTTLPTASAR